jgi:hypothetical protein
VGRVFVRQGVDGGAGVVRESQFYRQGISAAQVRKIHALKGAIGMNDDSYRGLLRSNFGVDSCKLLTVSQAASLIEILSGFQGQGIRDKGQGAGMASVRQVGLIRGLWSEVSYASDVKGRELTLRKFLKRIMGVEDVHWLRQEQVHKVVAAIFEMQRSKIKSQNKKEGEH